MSNIYFTSDTHFSHNRGFLYEPRGFSSIEEHDETIVENWNKVVKPEDIVFLLGDTMLNNNDKGIEYLNRLNGSIWFIRGNHDSGERIYRIYHECPRIHFLEGGSDNFATIATIKKFNGYNVYLSHYPTYTSYIENMAPLKQHMLNFHGHTHSKNKFYQDIPFMYNIALDAHNNMPVSFDEIISDIEAKANECIAML